MKPMQPLRSFWWALGTGWILLAVAAWEYARIKVVPAWLALPLAAAFLIEFSFYLASGFAAVREHVSRWPRPRIAMALTASALAPYLLYSTLTGQVALGRLAFVSALFILLACWYLVVPARLALDVLYLAVFAAAILSGVLRNAYSSPLPKVPLDILGHLALIHVAVFSILLIRGAPGLNPGFIPSRSDVMTGLRYTALFCVVGLPLAWVLGIVRMPSVFPPVWKIPATLLGVFWVVAYSEELFFRGLIQNWLTERMANRAAALVTASLLFGAVHLNYARKFPNWRVALIAATAGIFYGLAYRSARSIRASMVAHALVVTIWKTFGG
jgi:membrane protease YdiL (CAAX protease family)